MSKSAENDASGCGGGCRHCSALSKYKPAEDALKGWPLAGATACAFLLPLGLAVVGAILAGEGEARQFAGAGIGFAVGLVVGVIGARVINRFCKEKS